MKKIISIIVLTALAMSVSMQMSAERRNKWTADGAALADPDTTVLFAHKDTCDLYLDFYKASPGSVTEMDGRRKPAIIFSFGGGFMGGRRDKPHYQQWIKILNDNGYPVFSIDYRLGLKGVSVKGVKMIGAIRHSIYIGVEDLYSATDYIIRHAEELGVDAGNLVISGSSAGAIIAVQAEYDLCNGFAPSGMLPAGFRYAGVMSFSGAIFSTHGKVRYAEAPAPQLLLHGTEDRVVTYKSLRIFNLGLFGSSRIARQLDKKGYPYTIVRYAGHTHDIADLMYYTVPEQLRFLEESVVKKTGRTADILLDDPARPVDNSLRTLGDLYK